MKMSHIVAASAVLATTLMLPPAAIADVPDNSYIGVLGSFSRLDSKREAEDRDGYGGAVLYGRQFTNRWLVEGQLSYENFSQPNADTFHRYGLGVDAQYAFGDRTGFITPFALIGLGAVVNENAIVAGRSRDSYGYANIGAGVVLSVLGDWGPRIRAEVRYVNDLLDITDNGFRDLRANVGFEFALRRPVEEVPPPPPEPEPRVVEVEVERIVEVPVPRTFVRKLDGVNFELDSARLRPDSERILRVVAAELMETEPSAIEVRGHTCDLGSADYNQRLSERRAKAVMDFLIAEGVAEDVLAAKGLGEDEPLVANDSNENRERNRRVELRITE